MLFNYDYHSNAIELDDFLDRNEINYVTIETTGNTQDFGDLTYALYELGGFSDSHGGLAQ